MEPETDLVPPVRPLLGKPAAMEVTGQGSGVRVGEGQAGYLALGDLRAGAGLSLLMGQDLWNGPRGGDWLPWGREGTAAPPHPPRLLEAPACAVPKARCCWQTDVLFPALRTVLSSFREWGGEKALI